MSGHGRFTNTEAFIYTDELEKIHDARQQSIHDARQHYGMMVPSLCTITHLTN